MEGEEDDRHHARDADRHRCVQQNIEQFSMYLIDFALDVCFGTGGCALYHLVIMTAHVKSGARTSISQGSWFQVELNRMNAAYCSHTHTAYTEMYATHFLSRCSKLEYTCYKCVRVQRIPASSW